MMTPKIVLETLERLFDECDNPAVLCYLLKKVSMWSSSPTIRQKVLQSLDNIFAFACEDSAAISNLQFIVATLHTDFTLEEMLQSVEPGYIITNLNRAGCVTDSSFSDGFYINEELNERAVGVMNVFLTAFSDVGTKKQREYFQKMLVEGMKEAAIFGNWAQFRKIYEFATPQQAADECLEYCSLIALSLQRKNWLDANWVD